jgi:hypothetical protein
MLAVQGRFLVPAGRFGRTLGLPGGVTSRRRQHGRGRILAFGPGRERAEIPAAQRALEIARLRRLLACRTHAGAHHGIT